MGKVVELSGVSSGRGVARHAPSYLHQVKESVVVGFLAQNPDVLDMIRDNLVAGTTVSMDDTDWVKWAEFLNFEVDAQDFVTIAAEMILMQIRHALTGG